MAVKGTPGFTCRYISDGYLSFSLFLKTAFVEEVSPKSVWAATSMTRLN